MLAQSPVLITIELVATSIWSGSIVCLTVVTSVARRSLDPTAQVAFFRALGRRYGIVGTASLIISTGIGLAMLWPPSSWGSLADTAVALAGALVVLTGIGIRQARAMTRLRRQILRDGAGNEASERVRRPASVAAALRSAMGLITLALIAVVACLVGR